MTEGIKPSYEQGERGSVSLLISLVMGFSLFWSSFYTALIHNAAIDDTAAVETISPLAPVALCAGMVVMAVASNRWSDFLSVQKGHRFLWALVCASPVAHGAVSYAQFVIDLHVPVLVVFVASFLLGIGLSALLLLWSELLTAFTKNFTSKVLSFSMAGGSLLYFVGNCLPDGAGIAFTCLSLPASLAILVVLEREIPQAPFVSRKESMARHRLTKPIDALNTLYGAVFGIAIFGLSDAESHPWLHAGISLAIVTGALLMIPYLGKNTDKMMHGKVQKILFPLLVIGLLPMPFVDPPLKTLCILVILVGYVWLTLANLDSLFCLVKRFGVSPFYLPGRGFAPIIVGVAIGYAVGFLSAFTHSVGSDILTWASLVLVILLSVFVTVIPFDKDQLAGEHDEEGGATETHEQGGGRWKKSCETVVKRYGLSARETEVFYLIAKGWGSDYIQSKLYISPHTVKAHRYSIYKKVGVSSRDELMMVVEKIMADKDDDSAL